MVTPEPGSIDRWIGRWAGTDRRAFGFEGATITYRQLWHRIESVAAGLAERGVGAGDRVVYCGLNRLELFEVLFACARLGAIFCPLNNRLTTAELAFQIGDSRPSALLTCDGFDTLVGEAAAQAGIGAPVRDLDATPFADLPTGSARPVPTADDAADGPLDLTAVSAPERPVLMVYTSGTTGRPKGAVLTQSGLLYTCLNSIDHQRLSGDDCIIAPLPTFHVGGLNIQTLPVLLVGGRVLLQRRFDPTELLDLLAEHRPTQTLLVPAMLRAVADHPRFAEADLSSLVGINTGSSIVPEAVMRPYFDRGVPVGQVYGTTETGPTAVVLPYDEAADHIGSCGRPARFTELRIVDGGGADVGVGEPGELWVRGPNLFSYYWDDPPATAEAFVDGWYRTGDVGYRDGDGYVYIADRVTDVVISGGENVYPAEVEAVLSEHPAIVEVAVIGRPDPRWGETPVAVAVLQVDHDLELDDLRAWCDARLARFKQPRELVTVTELPRTALGKVRKHVLRDQLESS